jgi:hypothetical protein
MAGNCHERFIALKTLFYFQLASALYLVHSCASDGGELATKYKKINKKNNYYSFFCIVADIGA